MAYLGGRTRLGAFVSAYGTELVVEFYRIESLDDIQARGFDAAVHTSGLTDAYLDRAGRGDVQLDDVRPQFE